MKKLMHYIVTLTLALFLYACPTGIDFPLGNPGKEKIDPKLLGTWITDNEDAEVFEVNITKIDDFSYKVDVIDKGILYEPDSDILTGWITKIEDKLFFYARPENETKFYHYMILSIDSESMTTVPVSLLEGGIDVVKSSETLRNEVKKSMNKPEFIAEKTVWYKE